MSKRILVSVALVGLFWFGGATTHKLLANEVMDAVEAAQMEVAENLMAEHPTPTPDFLPARPAHYHEKSDAGRKARADELDGLAKHARNAGQFALGTFSVVSDGKRSIMLNSSTGDSWLLMFDNPGSHWDKIGKDAPPEQTGSQLSLSERHEAFQAVRDKDLEASNLRDERDARRRMEEVRVAEISQLRDEVAELKKQLKDAQDALKARDKEAQADVIDASQVK